MFPPERFGIPRILQASLRAMLTAFMGLGFVPGSADAQEGLAGPLNGELKVWHKITANFTGPETSETATPNPFTDYRLNVTFTHLSSGRSFVVPGYYAADGNAANSSAADGHVWRVHFAPDAAGEWSYAASFRAGPKVATNPDPAAGESAGFFDGATGQFVVAASDKSGRDLRGKGRLEYVGKHHLRFSGSGKFFMKAGADSPENLLSYADFDGSFKTDGKDDNKVKTWTPHLADWQPGDPEWQGGKGHGLIGAINYLASEGLNSFSFLTMNINGDDKNVFPYLDYAERLRIDVSRMDQWGIVFDHGTRLGMHLHFKTQETENELLLDGGDMGDQRRLYYRELIARFGHNLALNWNLGEEVNDASLAQKVAWAQFFYDNDPYHHPIVIHNGASHFEMMGETSKLTGFSLQLNEADFSDTFFQTRRYVKRSADFGKPWVIGTDEPGDSRLSVRPDNDAGSSHLNARRDALWANIMAGGAGCEFYFGADKPESDLTLQNFRSRDLFWDYCRHAVRFFEENPIPFEQMSNANPLVSGYGDNANRCLAKVGSSYLVQLRDGGNHTLDLSGVSGTFSVKWFNPRSGGALISGGSVEGGGKVPLGNPPDSATEDWIVVVRLTSEPGAGFNQAPATSAGPDRSAFLRNGAATVGLQGAVSDDGLPSEFSLLRTWSQVSGPAVVAFSSLSTISTVATFPEAGSYVLRLSATDSELSSEDEVEVTILAPDTGIEYEHVPVADAFVSQGSVDNGPQLFAGGEGGAKIRSYLKFDLSALAPGEINRAVLRLTQGADIGEGPMTLRLFTAGPGEWNEETLTAANAPAKLGECASHWGYIGTGEMVEFDVSGVVTAPGVYTFILEADPTSADMSFHSRDNVPAGTVPVLAVTIGANHPPLLAGFFLLARVSQPVSIPDLQILSHASDPDGDPLSVDMMEGSSMAGGQVSLGEGGIIYTPPIDFSGPDSLVLTIHDDRGGFATAELTISVTNSDGIDGRSPLVEMLPAGAIRLSFSGQPGFPYKFERSSDLLDWVVLQSYEPDAIATELDYVDENPPPTPFFYRVRSP